MGKTNRTTKRFIATLMAFIMVVTLFTNVVFKVSSAEDKPVATPTDSAGEKVEDVFYNLTLSARETDGEVYDAKRHESANITGVEYGVYKDESCTDETDTFVLSFNGKSYVDTDSNPVLYDSEDKLPEITEEKKVSLKEGTYYIKQKPYLYRSDKTVSDTGIEYAEDVITVELTEDMTAKVIIKTLESATVQTEEQTEEPSYSETSAATPTDAPTEAPTDAVTEETLTEEEMKDKGSLAEAISSIIGRFYSLATLSAEYPVDREQGYGLGGGIISYKFTVDSSLTYGGNGVGFCMEEGVVGPSGQSGTLMKVGNKDITRALYYSPYGAEPWSGFDRESEGTKVMVISCVLDHYYNLAGNGYNVSFGSNIDLASSYVSWLGDQPYPKSEADVMFTMNGKKEITTTAAYKSGTEIKTGTVTMKGGNAKVTLPSGVNMYVLTTANGATYKKCASGTVVKNGYKLYFTASPSKSGTSTIKFTGEDGYDAYKIEYDTLQDVGFLGKPKSMTGTIKVTWQPGVELMLEKQTDEIIDAYARYKLADNNDSSKSFETGKRKGVAFSVTNAAGTKVGSFICSWNGKCYANGKGQKLVFASKSDYDAYKANHSDLAYQKLTVPAGTYTATEKSTAFYFNGSTVVNSGVSIRDAYGITDVGTSTVKATNTGKLTFTLTPSDKAITGAFKMSKRVLKGDGSYELKAGAVYTMYEGKTVVAKFTTQASTYAKVSYTNPAYASLELRDGNNQVVSKNGVKLAGIPVGTYTIKETKTANGCEPESKDHFATLTINGSGETLVSFKPEKVNGQTKWTKEKQEDGSYNIYYRAYDETVGDPVNLEMVKVDAETGETVRDSAASLEGAVFKLEYYEGKTQDEVDNGTAGTPKKWHIKTLNVNGRYIARFNKNNVVTMVGDSGLPDTLEADGTYKLPAGTVVITEETAPEGFLKVDESEVGAIRVMNSKGAQTIKNTNSVSLYLGGTGTNYYYGNALTSNAIDIYEPVMRGDVAFTKEKANEDGSTSPMAGVVFKITDKSTGEYHYVVTDSNGKFSSKETRKDIENLNKNCEEYEELKGGYRQGSINSSYGVWFTGNSDISCEDIDKTVIKADRGSFPYGTYAIEEMRCDANKGYVLSDAVEFTIGKDMEDVTIPSPILNVPYPSLTTLADHSVKSGDDVTLKDEITFKWLKSDTTYTVKGVIMDKSTGLAAKDGKGNYITKTTTFTTPKSGTKYLTSYALKGKDAVKFTFTSTGMESEYVVFEYLYEGTENSDLTIIDDKPETDGVMTDDKGNEISHADIKNTDGSQTFRVVKISTKAFVNGDTEINRVQATENTKITDRVSYEGLNPGEKYTLKAKIVIAANSTATATDAPKYTKGEEVKVNGKVLEAEEGFTAGDIKDTVDVDFAEFDATPYDGCTVVIYEYLYDKDGNLLASEEDITDKNQTIYFITIKTTSNNDLDPNARMKLYDREITLVDKVSCTNLEIGKTYRVDGVLMCKEDNTEVKRSDGSVVTGSTTFVATESNCMVEVEFTYNPADCGLIGKTTVVFEDLFYKDKNIATHSDIEDLPQTNVYPLVKTLLTSKKDGGKVLDDSYKAELVDKITYDKLIAGERYVIVDKLVRKSDGKPVMVNGKEITATKSFTAKSEKGTVKVSYKAFDLEDAGLIKNGKADDIVAFAYLYLGAVDEVNLKAYEEDINCKEQTVTIKVSKPEIGTTFHLKGSDDKAFAVEDKTVYLTDTVKYKGLKKDTKYRLEGYIVIKDTGDKMKKDGSIYKVTKTFKTTKSTSGTVDVDFSFNPVSSGIMRKDGGCSDLVCYEYLYEGNKKVAEHADITSGGQTVYPAPTGKTKARDKATGTQIAYPGEKVTIVDHIYYKDLIVGKTYEVKGSIRFKDTGEKLNVPGTEKTETFVARESSGVYKMVFTFDAAALMGEQIVFFERVETNGKEVFVHEDLNDKDQTISFPELHTVATTGGKKELTEGVNNLIIDEITYKNLEAGATYKKVGKLVCKETNEVVATAEDTFTPEGEGIVNGKTTMEFNLFVPAQGDKNLTYVVFEYFYNDKGTLIGQHEDIDSKEQSVYVKYSYGPDTGDKTPLKIFVIIFAAALVGMALILKIKRKRR